MKMASSVVAIDNWSDSEIRTKLAELGTPVGPVTETTRKILIKKLKRLLQLQSNNAGSPVKQRRSLVRYSSGEDSQGEETNMPPPTTKVRNLRRKTTGSAELLSALADSSVNAEVSGQNAPERTTRGSRRSIGNASVLKINDSFDTDSDSDVSLTYLSSRLRKSRKGEATVSDRLSPKPVREVLQDTKHESPKPVNSLRKATEILSRDRIPEFKKTIQEEYEEEEEEEQEDTEEEESEKPPVFQSDFLSRLSTGGSLSSRYRSSVSPKPQSKPISSYVPSFTTFGSSRPDNRSFTTRHQINSFTSRSTDYIGADDYSSMLKRRQAASLSNITPKVTASSFLTRYKNNVKLLVICAGLFALLLVAYFLLFTKFSTTIYLAAIDSDENKYPICGQEGVNPQVCVQDTDLKDALDVSKIFIPRLQELAIKAHCDPPSAGDNVGVPIISEEEALKYLSTKIPTATPGKLVTSLRNFKILVLSNPHWEVEIVTKGLTEINAILFNGEFTARRVDLPVGCYLRLMTYSLIKIIVLGAVLVGSVFATLYAIRWFKRRQEKHKQDVYSMVNQILSLLSAHYEQNSIPGYLAVDNCRDELIQPIERDRKKRMWEDAVEYLEKNESRVRTEVHSVRGENVKVWRWLPAGGPPHSPSTSMDSTSAPILGRLL